MLQMAQLAHCSTSVPHGGVPLVLPPVPVNQGPDFRPLTLTLPRSQSRKARRFGFYQYRPRKSPATPDTIMIRLMDESEWL
jgi:hypothetical protein